MKIALLAPSHKDVISQFLPSYNLLDLPNGYGGAPFMGTLINELLLRGHEVIAITTNRSANLKEVHKFHDGKFTWIVVPQRVHSFMPNRLKLGYMTDCFSFERRQMLIQLKIVNPDIVHAHWGYEFAHVAINSGKPHLVTLHDNPYKIFYFFRNLYRFCRLIYSEIIFTRMKFKSTVSPYMFSYATRWNTNLKVIPNPIKIIYNFEFVKELIQFRELTIARPKIFMIMNGWDKRKNGLNGLEAFKLFKCKFPNAELHLFGNGTEIHGKAYSQANYCNLKDVFYHGPTEYSKLIEMITKFHLLIHPAIEESFGMVLIEAMALGIPCIGGKKSGAVPWVVNNTELLADIKNPEEICQKMVSCFANYYKVSELSFLNVNSRFNSVFVVDQFMEYYSEIMSKC